jgi:hypothetical protein
MIWGMWKVLRGGGAFVSGCDNDVVVVVDDGAIVDLVSAIFDDDVPIN